jgi:hypothetical protein
MPEAGLRDIPWVFQHSELTKRWQWTTPHFQVTISDEGRGFHWELADLVLTNDGLARHITEGRDATWDQAERQAREAVGKSYPPRLGYGPFVGTLATTFVLATGARVDLGEFNGQQVVVTVRFPDRSHQSFVGYASVIHYELVLEPAEGAPIRIQPAHITNVVREGGGAASVSQSDYLGTGRMYRGTPSRACTGRAGFMPNTLDHSSSAPCPVHEQTIRRYAAPVASRR